MSTANGDAVHRWGRGAGRFRRTLAAPALAASIPLLLAACGSSTTSNNSGAEASGAQSAAWGATINTQGTPVHGGTLTIDQNSSPVGVSALHFIARPQNAELQIVSQISDQLVEYQPGSIDPQPALASSWQISSNGLTYTFHLRHGVKFSNGMPLTSHDVAFSLDRARAASSFFVGLYKTIKSIATPDANTVVLRLSKPAPAMLHYLALTAAEIMPAKLIAAEGDAAFEKHPIGTGPFMLKAWVRGQYVELVRNPNYWQHGLPYLNKVVLHVTSNDNTRVLDVMGKTSDVADFVPFSQIKTVDASGHVKVIVGAGADMFVIWFNSGKKPFDELAVRQALNYATPRAAIDKVVFGGVAPQMNTVYPKLKYWDASVPAYTYDLAKAKELLAKSSVPHGFSTTISITGSDQASTQVAQIVQQAYSKIGVTVTIQRYDEAGMGELWEAGKTQLALFPAGSFTSDVAVDDEFTTLMFNSPETHNLFSFLKDPAAAALTEKAVTALTEGEQAKDFAQLQELTMKDPPNVPLIYTPNRAAVSDAVHNFNYLLPGYWRLAKVWKE